MQRNFGLTSNEEDGPYFNFRGSIKSPLSCLVF